MVPHPAFGFALTGVTNDQSHFPPLTVWVRDPRGGRAVKLTIVGVLDPAPRSGSASSHLRTRSTAQVSRSQLGHSLPAGPPRRERQPRRRWLEPVAGRQSLRASEIGEDVRTHLGLRMLLNHLLQAFIGRRAAGGRRRPRRASACGRWWSAAARSGCCGRSASRGRAVQATFLLEASAVALLGIGDRVGLGIGSRARLVAYIGREFPEIVVHGAVGADRRDRALCLPDGRGDGGLASLERAGRVQPSAALRYE